MADEDEDYFLPVQDQRAFGAGIKRKRIAFVPATSPESSISSGTAPQSTSAAAEARYLSIVLRKSAKEKEDLGDQNKSELEAEGDVALSDQVKLGPEGEPDKVEPVMQTCPVCRQSISSPNDKVAMGAHESSIAHQVCLEHSHPPSHLDREHVGLRYLTSYGWDPDSRTGLGARQEGIRIPVKPKEKKDTAGLRETVEDDGKVTKRKVTAKKDETIVRLNAKQVRMMDTEAKKKAERLRRSFYGPDLEQYLGPNS
ncbi:hypothetical protein A1O3_04966 [Capronia epimyces CBS 606.96]|uniref:G-patch domain-containing protein n=1 Tax=Capronia epimyces CBS 606.96 TaxID=1182542 RepID=W9YPW6_9EURO|nr:uncharacterized protein A1O3_04966 [Capronia epimyces CBS 606.96]EXJ84299.1 hypothetical protein A1O3_04966 [Capronia epimyces CBS 606.96]